MLEVFRQGDMMGLFVLILFVVIFWNLSGFLAAYFVEIIHDQEIYVQDDLVGVQVLVTVLGPIGLFGVFVSVFSYFVEQYFTVKLNSKLED